jgi:glycolate oxidase
VSDILEQLVAVLGEGHVQSGEAVEEDLTHDEGLTSVPSAPLAVVRPTSTAQVAATLRLAHQHRVPVVARGRGTGLSGAAVPLSGGLLVAFDRMDRILEVDPANQVAVVQPGVTLGQLDAALAPLGLLYPVSPGEPSASLGGNVATNAGGMRAVRYGVTRQHVLGLEAVLADGRVLRTGGKFVKSSTGYDLTQLLVGSEGTLALVTEVTLRVQPRPGHAATVLAPFGDLADVTAAVERILSCGLAPTILEYLDELTMASVTAAAGINPPVPEDVRAATSAYLVVVTESRTAQRLDEDVDELGQLLDGLGARDVYVLPPSAGASLIAARERAFYAAKAAGADDIVDTVVPRASVAGFLVTVGRLAAEAGALVAGCGHVGDGNVHLSVFQPDPVRRAQLLGAVMAEAVRIGGAVSGEHGIGTAKLDHFAELEDPVRLELRRRVKEVFDPIGILNPGRLLPEGPER